MRWVSKGLLTPMIPDMICGGCLVGAGILLAFIGIRIVRLYKKCCWDMITIMVMLISMAIVLYLGEWIKIALPVNILLLLLFVQSVYVGIRWYVKGCGKQEASQDIFDREKSLYCILEMISDTVSAKTESSQSYSYFIVRKVWSTPPTIKVNLIFSSISPEDMP